MKNNNKAFDFIYVNFLYNGNLGILQQKTIDNRATADKLLFNGIINGEEYKEIMQAIEEYFKTEIKKVLENTTYYLI